MGQCSTCRYENCGWPMHCPCVCHAGEESVPVSEARLSERRAVLLRVAAELRAEAEPWASHRPAVEELLLGLALRYEREAAEVK